MRGLRKLGSVRTGFRTLGLLVLCAASLGAAFSHVAIDAVGDFALPHDTYDYVPHASRDLITAIALAIGAVLALRGLRLCFAVANANRGRLLAPAIGRFTILGCVASVVAIACVLVPAMEVLDGRLAGVPVTELDDAFGGSLLLGLSTTGVCAAAVAVALVGLFVTVVSHRDHIVAAIVSLVERRERQPLLSVARDFFLARPRKRRAAPALRRAKRGPPHVAFA